MARRLSGWTRFMVIYALCVVALFVVLVFVYYWAWPDWFFPPGPSG
jgi:hypothetical protein